MPSRSLVDMMSGSPESKSSARGSPIGSGGSIMAFSTICGNSAGSMSGRDAGDVSIVGTIRPPEKMSFMASSTVSGASVTCSMGTTNSRPVIGLSAPGMKTAARILFC